jgi:long-chain acyl-CoA synthetase
MMNLVRALRSTLRHHGARTAVLDGAERYTWTEFGDRVARLAGALRLMGLGPGARFAILSRNGFRVEELRWAGYWIGAVPVPINMRLAAPEIAHVLDDARCRIVFAETAFVAAFDDPVLAPWRAVLRDFGAAHGDAAAPYETMLRAASAAAPGDPSPDEDAILLYTGGTTGRSKGVRLSHANIVSNALAFGLAQGARTDDVFLHVAPMFHSADLLATAWFLSGAAQCYLPAFSPASFLAAIAHYRASATVTVPTILQATVADPGFARADVSSLRVLIYGAAPMSVEWIERAAAAFPRANFSNCYGLTETAPDLTVFDPREFRAAIESGDRNGPVNSVGRPNLLNEVKIVRADGSEAAPNEPGELLARGPNIMTGYLNRPAETAEALRDGWLHTGDIARIDERGYVYLLDRLKDMVITGGENVYCSEVEAVLHRHPGVAEAAVIGLPDERLGETVAAVIVPRPGTAPDAGEIERHCRAAIGGFKVPRRIVFADRLPKSALGKVLKHELRKTHGSA